MKICALVFRVPGRHGGGMPPRDRLLAALVAALWGANFLAIHVGLQHFPPLFLAALRFAVIALPTVLFVPRPQVRLRWLLGYGLGFGTLQFLFLFVAMDVGMPTGLASLVLQASAPFTVVLGAVLLRERLTVRQCVGIGLAVLGLAAIAVARAQTAALVPVLLTLAGALGWALGNLCSRLAAPPNPLHLTLWMSVVPPVQLNCLASLVVRTSVPEVMVVLTPAPFMRASMLMVPRLPTALPTSVMMLVYLPDGLLMMSVAATGQKPFSL